MEKDILEKSLNEINQWLYAIGFVSKVGMIPKQRRRRTLYGKPKWQIRIQKQVEKMRTVSKDRYVKGREQLEKVKEKT